MKTYKHSKAFWTKKYNQYKKEVKSKGGTALNKSGFMAAYEAIRLEGSKDPGRELVYASKYGTRYKTAVAEKKALERIGIKAKLEDLKTMETTDFARAHATELAKAYRNLRASGITGKAAKVLISQQWFGSN